VHPLSAYPLYISCRNKKATRGFPLVTSMPLKPIGAVRYSHPSPAGSRSGYSCR